MPFLCRSDLGKIKNDGAMHHRFFMIQSSSDLTSRELIRLSSFAP